MTRQNVLNGLNTMSRLLNAGKLGQLADVFERPLPFYENAEMKMVHDRADVLASLTLYRDDVIAEGAVKFVPELISIESSSELRCLLLMKWNHIGADGTVLSDHGARYVMRFGPSKEQFRIELVECGHSVLTRSCIPDVSTFLH